MTPTTKAGDAAMDTLIGFGISGRAAENAIAAIEAEARSQERERIRAALDADPFYGAYKTPRGRLNAILAESTDR